MSSTKKVVLVGHFGVGKSSLIRRFVQNIFSDDYLVTIGVHILKKTIVVNNQETTIILWDIEGKEDIQTVRSSYLIGTSGFIYVIDPTRVHTYQNLNNELKFIAKNYSKTPIITVCNKVDLIDLEDFEKVIEVNELKIDYFTSAKKGENVEEIFMNLALKMSEK
jgi:small GTP-binding protein